MLLLSRTVARICDIPTSIVQLTGISGVSPASVVDPKYVRSEASFSEEDKDRLYNDILASRWVRPVHLRLYGHENTSGKFNTKTIAKSPLALSFSSDCQ